MRTNSKYTLSQINTMILINKIKLLNKSLIAPKRKIKFILSLDKCLIVMTGSKPKNPVYYKKTHIELSLIINHVWSR